MMASPERAEEKKVCLEGHWDDDDWAWLESALYNVGLSIDDDDVTVDTDTMTTILQVKGDKAEQWSRFLEDRGIVAEDPDRLEQRRKRQAKQSEENSKTLQEILEERWRTQ